MPFWLFAINAGICLTLVGVNALAIHTTRTALAAIVQHREEGWCEGYFLATEVARRGRDDIRHKLGLGLGPIVGDLVDAPTASFSNKMVGMVLTMIDSYVVPPDRATFQDTDSGISFDCLNGDLVTDKPARRSPGIRPTGANNP